MSAHVSRYGPNEIALRHRIDRLSLLVSAARHRANQDGLLKTTVKITYPAILDGLHAMDKERADARKYRGEMTAYALGVNEANARILSLHADVCSSVLRQALERGA